VAEHEVGAEVVMTADAYLAMSDDAFAFAWMHMLDDERRAVPGGYERYVRIMGPIGTRLDAPGTRQDRAGRVGVHPEPADPFARLAAPSLPLALLPDTIAAWAVAHSIDTGFDAGAYGFAALIAASGVIDHRARLAVSDGFTVPPFQWGALVDLSGGGKTPVLEAAIAPIRTHNDALARASRDTMAQYEAEIESAGRGAKPPRPPWRQVLTNNATIEGLTVALNDNPSGVLLHSDELTEWIGRMDAYSAGGNKDRAAFLTAHGGGSLTVNRARANLYVESFSLGILGGIQPAKLAALLGERGSGDGLVQRFLCYCPATPGPLTYRGVDARTLREYSDTLTALIGWTGDGTLLRSNAVLSAVAREAHREYHNDLRRLGTLNPPGRLTEHIHKLPGLAARLTFVLHALECAQAGVYTRTVNDAVHGSALAMMRCLFDHACVVYGFIDTGQEQVSRLTQTAAEAILSKRWTRFTWSDLTRHATHWRDADEAPREAALLRLADFGWITDDTATDTPRRGRRSAGAFLVNPLVPSRYADRAREVTAMRRARAEAISKAGTNTELVD
jgi:hypothetical protein